MSRHSRRVDFHHEMDAGEILVLGGQMKMCVLDRPTRNVSCLSNENSSPLWGPAVTVRMMRMLPPDVLAESVHL